MNRNYDDDDPIILTLYNILTIAPKAEAGKDKKGADLVDDELS